MEEEKGGVGSCGGAQWSLLCIVQMRLSLKKPGLAPKLPSSSFHLLPTSNLTLGHFPSKSTPDTGFPC